MKQLLVRFLLSIATTFSGALAHADCPNTRVDLKKAFPGIRAPQVRKVVLKGSKTSIDKGLDYLQSLQKTPLLIDLEKPGEAHLELTLDKAESLRKQNIAGLNLILGQAMEPWSFEGLLNINDSLVNDGFLESTNCRKYTVVLIISDVLKNKVASEINSKLADALSLAFPDRFPKSMSVEERIALFFGQNGKDVLSGKERKAFAPKMFAIQDEGSVLVKQSLANDLNNLGISEGTNLIVTATLVGVLSGIQLEQALEYSALVINGKAQTKSIIIDKVE